ncbi:ladderlectin-like [Parambassis ranga]|uniref:Ladderlectin-like n=1 Tax=Parambassis ranga TaxID=210632 RepID=A0A6P7IC74_9TELE|nr:ladderlectin-like [Parambassis ranga]
MKSVLILCFILCAAVSTRAATVAVAEAADVQQEDNPAPEVDADTAADAAAAVHQVQLSFCPDGWLSYRGSCYYFSNHPNTWKNAESYCAGFESNLASVHNIWEYTFLQRTVRTAGHTLAWIGGYYFQDDWRWEDGTLFNYNNWYNPSSSTQYQCLQLSSEESKGWSNHDCILSFPFICQMKSNC